MIINADKTNLNSLLGIPNRQLTIPPFQRPYAWESEQIDELWHDIVDTIGRGHFMGSIVLCSTDKQRPEVIDGQQRLTSILLLLSLIRDQYQSFKPEITGRIQQFLENSYAEPNLRFKFKPGNANSYVFTDFVLSSPEDPARRDWNSLNDLDRHDLNRNANLIENRQRLSHYLNTHLDSSDNSLAAC